MKAILRTLVIALLALLLLPAAGCPPNPGPAGTGGAPGTGGAQTAGSVGSGGESPIAGAPGATGGVGAGGSEACPEFVEPTCNRATKRLSRAERDSLRKLLSGWHRDPVRAKTVHWRPSYSIVQKCSMFWTTNRKDPFKQRYGSCTANAVGGILSTQPFTGVLTQDDVDERIYPLATQIDPFPGAYPPNDTGSNGASAWLAAMRLGYTSIPSTPITSLEELQSAMQRVSCMIGVDWYETMFEPSPCGEISIGGAIAGGHELHVIGIDVRLKKVWLRNSWDKTYGLSRGDEIGGFVYMSFGTVQKLMAAGAEIDCPATPPTEVKP